MRRQRSLQRQGYASYSAYLRSKTWAKTKARYRASRMPQDCRVCGVSPVDLHHRSYARVGREKLHDLVPLCRKHHSELHDILRLTPRDKWYTVANHWVKEMRRVAA